MEQRIPQQLATIVGNNIASIRKIRGWSQADFAKMMGMGADSLSRIERGFVAPRFGRLQKFANTLGCSVATLFKTDANDEEQDVAISPEVISAYHEIKSLAKRILAVVDKAPANAAIKPKRATKAVQKPLYGARARRKHSEQAQ